MSVVELVAAPGWWAVAAVVALSLAAEVPRRRVDRMRRAARGTRAVRDELRARASTAAGPDAPVRGAELRRRAADLGPDARRAAAIAFGWGAVLVAVWSGVLLLVRMLGINSEWAWPRSLTPAEFVWIQVGAVLAVVLLLAAALARDRSPAPLVRAYGWVLPLVVAYGALVEVHGGVEARGTVLTALMVAVAPAARSAVVGLGSRPAGPVLTISDWNRVARLDPSPVGASDPGPAAPILDVVAARTLYGGAPVEGALPHVRLVRLDDASGVLVHKRFTAGGPGQASRNPPRPAEPYRGLLSRVLALGTVARAAADATLVWPCAVVAGCGEATGVLYPPIGAPFLLVDGGAQLGDRLLAEEPGFAGCAVPTTFQRGQIVLDVLRAHATLHELGLAHGDTCWRNFVYGIDAGRGRAMVIDVDGVTDQGATHPLLLEQPGWECPVTMRPADRDVRRCALLVARLATLQPSWDRISAPDVQTLEWYEPGLDQLVRAALHGSGPVSVTIAAMADALDAALSALGDRRDPTAVVR